MKALGLIETKGMVATVEAVDSMLKAADVSLVTSMKAGAGLVTAVVEGDVAAVKAAVDAGAAAVRAINPKALKSEDVIPRPDDSIRIVLKRGGRKHASRPNAPDPDPSPDNGGGVPVPEASEIGSAESGPESVVEEAEAVTVNDTDNAAAEASDNSVQEELKPEPETEAEAEAEAEPAAEIEAEAETEPEPEAEVEAEAETEPEPEAEVEAEPEMAELPQVKDRESIDQVVADAGVDALDTALEGLRVSELRKLARGYSGFSLTGRDISKANKKMLIEAFKDYYNK